jgi:hypothetical protein
MDILTTNRLKWICLLLLVAGSLFTSSALAQKINFSTWTNSDEITITPVQTLPKLDFNQKQNIITKNSAPVIINLADMQAVGFRIEAPDGFDLTVEIDAPLVLRLDGSGSESDEIVPLQLGIAYSNQQAIDESSAKGSAVQLPPGFYNVTFPVNRRRSGAPSPPPTPISGDYVRPKATAWLFIYGTLGPVGPIKAGSYTENITINVYFTNND